MKAPENSASVRPESADAFVIPLHHRLAVRLAFILILLFMWFLVGSVWDLGQIRNEPIKEIHQVQIFTSKYAANAWAAYRDKIRTFLILLANQESYIQDMSGRGIALAQSTRQAKWATAIEVVDINGITLTSRESNVKAFSDTEVINLCKRVIKKGGILENQVVFGEFRTSLITGRLAIPAAVPIFKKQAPRNAHNTRGKSYGEWWSWDSSCVRGFLLAEIDPQVIAVDIFGTSKGKYNSSWSFLENYYREYDGAYCRRVVAAQDVARIGSIEAHAGQNGLVGPSRITNPADLFSIIKGAIWWVLMPIDPSDKIVTSYSVEGIEILIQQPVVNIHEMYYESGTRFMSMLCAAIILTAMSGYAIRALRQIVCPLEELVAATKLVMAGNFTIEVKTKLRDEFGALIHAFNRMVLGLREREMIKDTFGRYVSRQVADRILGDESMRLMGGERREVTVLFADIRGFTPYSESSSPEDVVATLNEYFARMIDVIFRHEGMLDKFIGDCIMAVFNAPHDQEDHAERGVLAAIEMREALQLLNECRNKDGRPPIAIGIGVNTGEAVSGNVGSVLRTEFSVIGDSVNLASRLEGASLGGQILIGEETYRRTINIIDVRILPLAKIKGKRDDVRIYEVLGKKRG